MYIYYNYIYECIYTYSQYVCDSTSSCKSSHTYQKVKSHIIIIYMNIYIYIVDMCDLACVWLDSFMQIKSHIITSQVTYYNYMLIERNPPPWGGFLLTMFPDQEPCVRDFTTRCDGRISSWNLLHTALDQGTTQQRNPPGGGGFLRSMYECIHILSQYI